MPRETQRKVIDGIEFEVAPLGPRSAQRVLVRTMGLLSASMGKAFGALGAGTPGKPFSLSEAQVDFAALGEAVPALFARLTPEELEALQKELLGPAWALMDGKRLELWTYFDSVFAQAEVFTPLKVTLFAFETNFGNFSAALAGSLEALRRGGGQKSTSSNTLRTTGLSGAS